MEYSHTDDELIQQPIGYWGWAAQKAVVTYIRAGLAEFDVTQPQWWVMAQVAHSDDGKTREEVSAVLKGYLDVGSALHPEIDTMLDRQLLLLDDDARLHLTPEGDALFRKCVERQTAVRQQIHAGIPDEEYVTTLKVLQRMIHNVGGEAWHH